MKTFVLYKIDPRGDNSPDQIAKLAVVDLATALKEVGRTVVRTLRSGRYLLSGGDENAVYHLQEE